MSACFVCDGPDLSISTIEIRETACGPVIEIGAICGTCDRTLGYEIGPGADEVELTAITYRRFPSIPAIPGESPEDHRRRLFQALKTTLEGDTE